MGDFPTHSVEPDVTVIVPAGRLNLVTAPDLRHQLQMLVDAGKTRIVVDLAGVESIDSSGLGALISGIKAARQGGGDLRVTAPGEQVIAVLELSNLDRVLQVYDSAESAFSEPAERRSGRGSVRDEPQDTSETLNSTSLSETQVKMIGRRSAIDV